MVVIQQHIQFVHCCTTKVAEEILHIIRNENSYQQNSFHQVVQILSFTIYNFLFFLLFFPETENYIRFKIYQRENGNKFLVTLLATKDQ